MSKEEFIKKAKEIHKNRYDYSLVEYKNNHTKVKIICPEHGIFEQNPYSHLKGCNYFINKKLNTEEFIKKSREIHKNKYDYSLVKYVNANTKVKIICPEHGVFEQIPYSHLKGLNCLYCVKTIDTKTFIEKSKKIHKNKYDYSLVKFNKSNIKIEIICPEHGIFKQTPNNHLCGFGCPSCAGNKKLTTKDFIKKSKKIHGNRYDYSLVEYKNANTKVKIICKKHGIFKQTPYKHLKNQGCPNCKNSKGETLIRNYLENKKILFEQEKIFKNCKNKQFLPFDFYLPEYNICIEYDGIQHFKPIEIWGGVKSLKENQKRDKIKTDYCKENNIYLIRIKYNQNIKKQLNKI